MKRTVAVLFGGKSCEHSVSIVTAVQAMACLDREKYRVIPVYVREDGVFTTHPSLATVEDVNEVKNGKKRAKEVFFLPASRMLYEKRRRRLCPVSKIDCALLCFHGLNGEDGTVQGLMRLCGIPFTSSDVLGSAVGMDKILQKRIFAALGLKTAKMIELCEDDLLDDSVFNRVEAVLSYPVMVKPANLGSSIGIARAQNREELKNALFVAASFDGRILVEHAFDSFKEVNCACVRLENELLVSEVESPVSWSSFLSYEEKYFTGGKTGGMDACKRELPAKISAELTNEIKAKTAKIYEGLSLSGVARVDFLIVGKEVFVNEVNTIPGSLAFYLFEEQGISFSALLDGLIEEGISRTRRQAKKTFAFRSVFGSKA